ncbi:hypothetical protein [Haloplanus salilacus]|uniref:hypothetical protein n=1 Tax=Haloplanus salilacus TaxID=2949994 RepID=UPI0030CA62E4
MPTTAAKNRWFVAASAMLIHLSIGSVYAYSVYQRPLQETQGWSIADVTLGFTLAIVTLGLSAAFLGRYVERYGPRVAGTAAAVGRPVRRRNDTRGRRRLPGEPHGSC